MGPYCNELVDDLEELIEDLAPDDEYISEAREAANKIFKHLQQEGPSIIARTKIAGSIGKGTGISFIDSDGFSKHPDLDLVVIVNDHEPPFSEIYEEWKEILLDLEGVKNVKLTPYSIQFKIDTPSFDGINVDLLAAENHVKNTSPYSGQDIGEVEAMFAAMNLDEKQKKAIMTTQTVSKMENKLSSSSFAEKTLKIVKSMVEDDFNLGSVRLAKYWIHGIDLKELGFRYVPAKSCLIETIAIKAQLTKRRNRRHGERCIVSGFRRFLERVSNLSTLKISLDPKHNASLKDCDAPTILDPGNKWNNLASGIHPEVIYILEQEATKTLALLTEMRNRRGYYQFENAIEELFCQKD